MTLAAVCGRDGAHGPSILVERGEGRAEFPDDLAWSGARANRAVACNALLWGAE